MLIREKKLKAKALINELRADIDTLLKNISDLEDSVDECDTDEELANICENLDVEKGLKYIKLC